MRRTDVREHRIAHLWKPSLTLNLYGCDRLALPLETERSGVRKGGFGRETDGSSTHRSPDFRRRRPCRREEGRTSRRSTRRRRSFDIRSDSPLTGGDREPHTPGPFLYHEGKY